MNRFTQRLMTFARSLWWGALTLTGIVCGPFLFRQRSSQRPVVALQAYAVHLACSYRTLIDKLLRDKLVDVVLLTWPHPQFPFREQARLREFAATALGLDSSRIVPLWKAMWRKFDMIISCDALTPLPLRATRTAQLFHGPMIQNRHFHRLLFRRAVSDFDLVFAAGPYNRELILGQAIGNKKAARVCVTGSPQFDRYCHPGTASEKYVQRLGLDRLRPIVLYAPHWSELEMAGRAGLRLLRETVEELRRLPVNVVMKFHAMSLVPGVARAWPWQEALAELETRHVKVDFVPDDLDALLAADVLVTGISSRACNFMLLDKPVVLYRSDFVPEYYKAQPAYGMLRRAAWLAETVEDLGRCVRGALANPHAHQEQRTVAREAFFANCGHAAEEVTRVIYEELGASPATWGGAPHYFCAGAVLDLRISRPKKRQSHRAKWS